MNGGGVGTFAAAGAASGGSASGAAAESVELDSDASVVDVGGLHFVVVDCVAMLVSVGFEVSDCSGSPEPHPARPRVKAAGGRSESDEPHSPASL